MLKNDYNYNSLTGINMTSNKTRIGDYFIKNAMPPRINPDTIVDGVLTTRFSTEHDLDQIQNFYEDNLSPYLTKRHPSIITDRVQKSKASITFLGTPDAPEQDIVYASLRYDYRYDAIYKGSNTIKHSEFGTQITIQKNKTNPLYANGLDLGRRGMTFQTIIGALYIDNIKDFLFQDIYDSNTVALKGIRTGKGRTLFTEFKATTDIIQAFEASATQKPPPRTFFQAQPSQLINHAQYLQHSLVNPLIKQKETGRQFLLSYPDIEQSTQIQRFISLCACPQTQEQLNIKKKTPYHDFRSSILKMIP